MTVSPKISFLITHYNRPHDLLKCLKAIHSLELLDYEVVVSDDASDDNTIVLLQSYSINKLIQVDKNQGLAANINKGLAACNGKYIIYCQEDFILDIAIKEIILECITLLDSGELDLIRFTSNFPFNKLKKLSDTMSLIPKFSFSNFFQNYYQYSDHPFITKKEFYDRFGLYQEGTSGRYGETEYGIRICNSKAKIGITLKTLASTIEGSESMLIHEFDDKKPKVKVNKPFIKVARAFRLYFEWIFYNKKKRGLITYVNGRKQHA